jgi:uncharacterized protein YciI
MAESDDLQMPPEIQQAITSGKRYTLLFYRKGPTRGADDADDQRIQIGHLKHMFEMRKKGLLILNGPLVDDDDIRGIGIFATEDIEEVRRLIAADPAVVAGRLTFDVHPWFGLPGDGLR